MRLRSIVEYAPSSLWTRGAGQVLALLFLTVFGVAFLAAPAVVAMVWTLVFGLFEVLAYVPPRLVRRADPVNRPRVTLPR